MLPQPKGYPSYTKHSQVDHQKTWCFPVYGMAIGLWLMLSSMPQRRLVLNHTRGMYHFSIQGRTVCQGPMHLVYVRLALSSDGDPWDRRGEGPTVRPDTPTMEAAYPLGSKELS